MQSKKVMNHSQPEDLFRSRLEQILNRRHPLFVLAERIDWSLFEGEFGALYHENIGCPGLPIRLPVKARPRRAGRFALSEARLW